MKLLLDSCISEHAYQVLNDAGMDVQWVANSPSDPGDEEILRIAYESGRVLVTLD